MQTLKWDFENLQNCVILSTDIDKYHIRMQKSHRDGTPARLTVFDTSTEHYDIVTWDIFGDDQASVPADVFNLMQAVSFIRGKGK